MVKPIKRATLNVELSTKERLIKRMKYGDSINKAIQDLLDLADTIETETNHPKDISKTTDNN